MGTWPCKLVYTPNFLHRIRKQSWLDFCMTECIKEIRKNENFDFLIGAPNGQLLLINKLNTAPPQSVSKLIRTNNNIANRLRMVDLVTRDEKATNETARKFRKSAWKLNVPRNSTDTALGHSNVSMAGEICFSFRLSIRSATFWNNFLKFINCNCAPIQKNAHIDECKNNLYSFTPSV